MLISSQGFHTFTISNRLPAPQAESVLDIMKKRDDVRVRPDYEKNKHDPFGHHWIVEYPGQFKGLTWNIRIRPTPDAPEVFRGAGAPVDETRLSNIKATINPKVFVGIRDYLTAANADYLGIVETQFNTGAKKISPLVGLFGDYSLIRNDYCLNVDVNELNLPCSPKQMITLIKRANIPPHYVEWEKYDTTSHRKKSGADSFYLKCNSVVVNYYWKYPQLQREFYECPDLEASRNVIRLEVQYRNRVL